MQTVTQIFDKYNTDKNSRHHNYGRQYEALFLPYREKNVRYLEIGVFYGESIKAMREVFKNCEVIVGIDIDPNTKKYEDKDNKIFVEIGDATDKNFLESVSRKYGPFDIILDDGSHVNKDVIKTFQIGFPLLKDDGLYIVEDTNVYNIQQFTDNSYPTHLIYFINFIHFLNQSRLNSSEGFRDYCADPFKILKKTNDTFECYIDKIEFGCSFIAIHKKIRTHWVI